MLSNSAIYSYRGRLMSSKPFFAIGITIFALATITSSAIAMPIRHQQLASLKGADIVPIKSKKQRQQPFPNPGDELLGPVDSWNNEHPRNNRRNQPTAAQRQRFLEDMGFVAPSGNRGIANKHGGCQVDYTTPYPTGCAGLIPAPPREEIPRTRPNRPVKQSNSAKGGSYKCFGPNGKTYITGTYKLGCWSAALDEGPSLGQQLGDSVSWGR